MASAHKEQEIAAQSEVEPVVKHESQSKVTAVGHPPQKEGAKYPLNTAHPETPYYIPHTMPPPGQVIKRDDQTPKVLQELKLRSVTFKNRIWLSPLCQYSCEPGTGLASDYHLIHQGQYSLKGAGCVFTEASGVLKNGRISPEDMGIWSDEHIAPLKRIVDFHHSQGAVAALQLAHAGRKASTYAPWLKDGIISKPPVDTDSMTAPPEANGWEDIWGPSAIPYDNKHATPKEMTVEQIKETTDAFVAAAKRALKAGYDVVEIHSAHGYLLHNFLSPVSNQRKDQYGGSFQNRVRFALETTKAVRAAWPAEKPLFYRISATDWHEKGEKDEQGTYISWGAEQTTKLAKLLKDEGVDLIDVSSGGNYSGQQIALGPGYQVPFAKILKDSKELEGLTISAVGLITEPKQAEEILQKGESDVIFLGREFMRNSDFVTQCAYDLGAPISVPVEYQRAHTRLYKPLHQ